MSFLDWGLTGRVVLVTGGAGAIGRAVCAGFAEAGARVAVVDLDPAACTEVADGLGGAHRGYGADLRDIAALPALVARIEAEMGLVTVLVNIAGIIIRTNDLFTVTEAEDGVVALGKAKGAKFNAVVTDVNMPNMDGITLIRHLRELPDYKFTPMLMLTTEAGADKKAEGKAAGATGWLVKPFNPDQLVATVKKVLG
jgi:two-component system chemotaxis response regulator CheY